MTSDFGEFKKQLNTIIDQVWKPWTISEKDRCNAIGFR